MKHARKKGLRENNDWGPKHDIKLQSLSFSFSNQKLIFILEKIFFCNFKFEFICILIIRITKFNLSQENAKE